MQRQLDAAVAACGLARAAVERDVPELQDAARRRWTSGAAARARAPAARRGRTASRRSRRRPRRARRRGPRRSRARSASAPGVRSPAARMRRHTSSPSTSGISTSSTTTSGEDCAQHRHRGLAALGLGDVVAGERERASQRVAHRALVVDDQHLHHGFIVGRETAVRCDTSRARLLGNSYRVGYGPRRGGDPAQRLHHRRPRPDRARGSRSATARRARRCAAWTCAPIPRPGWWPAT